jgi:hypothetical protein
MTAGAGDGACGHGGGQGCGQERADAGVTQQPAWGWAPGRGRDGNGGAWVRLGP